MKQGQRDGAQAMPALCTLRHVVRLGLGALALGLTGCVSGPASVVLYGGAPEEVAILRIPFNIDIRSLDGAEVSKALGRDEVALQIAPGSHQVEVRYSSLYPTRGSDFEKIESAYYVVRFDCARGWVYRIDCDEPRSLDAARRYARSPVFRILTVTAGGGGESVSGARQNAAHGEVPTTASGAASDTVSELRQVWDKASPAQRKAFLNAIEAVPRTEGAPATAP